MPTTMRAATTEPTTRGPAPDAEARHGLDVLPLGRIGYDAAWALQKREQARLIDAKRRGEVVPHRLFLVEHPPVVTLGQSGRRENVVATEDDLDARGIAFRHIDRGGDATYHGPGQMVGYLIADLDRLTPDLHVYLRTLEDAVIATLADDGIEAGRYVDAAGKNQTGVWVGPAGAERKICAFGIRCTRWVTMHGWALNLTTDLSHFDAIVPCGIRERGVTSLKREYAARGIDRAVDADDVARRLVGHLAARFGLSPHWLDPDAAWASVDADAEAAGA